LLALNTDIRTLGSCLAREKIQLGVNLTKGLGTGGDPELGHQAVLEAEDAIRAAVKGRRIVFLCTGLGGGTGSGAAPIVTRISREEGAFVVVFATMPFAFEGKRRRDQAQSALNELAVLSNALVTFDNNRMGELVLAKQGVHDAFVAADNMICESMKAVIRLVIRPGLINIGLDDLMSALRTTRSRCLFGSGIANGKDRAARALRNALSSPLLDQGSLLKEAQTVLVHLCGGADLTLFEIELLMQRLQKFVPEQAHVLFGAAVDPAMGDAISLTLISALPEDSLIMPPRDSLSRASRDKPLPVSGQSDAPATEPASRHAESAPLLAAANPQEPRTPPAPAPVPDSEIPPPVKPAAAAVPAGLLAKLRRAPAEPASTDPEPTWFDDKRPAAKPEDPPMAKSATPPGLNTETGNFAIESPPDAGPPAPKPASQPVMIADFIASTPNTPSADIVETAPDPQPSDDDGEWNAPDSGSSGASPIPKKRPPGVTPWAISQGPKSLQPELDIIESSAPAPAPEPEPPRLKLGIKPITPQSELSLDSSPRGRFEGESPNVFDGEDLDLPPFLRKKK